MNKFSVFDKLRSYSLPELRREDNYSKIKKPSKPGAARKYGYRAKKGFQIYRFSFKKGGVDPIIPARGRKRVIFPYSRNISLKTIALNKLKKKHPNLVLLGAYEIIEDGKRKWFEAIFKDPYIIVK